MNEQPSEHDKTRAEELIIEAWDELNTGNHDEAMNKASIAFGLDQNDWYINTSIGLFHRARGELQTSKKFCERAVELAPEISQTWENLAVTSLHQQQFNLAVMHFTKAVELEEKPGTYTMMASAKIALSDLPGAIKDATRALELDPEWDEAEALLKQAEDLLAAE